MTTLTPARTLVDDQRRPQVRAVRGPEGNWTILHRAPDGRWVPAATCTHARINEVLADYQTLTER